jgi:hypothetical protein
VLAITQGRIERPEGVALFHWGRMTALKKGGASARSLVDFGISAVIR